MDLKLTKGQYEWFAWAHDAMDLLLDDDKVDLYEGDEMNLEAIDDQRIARFNDPISKHVVMDLLYRLEVQAEEMADDHRRLEGGTANVTAARNLADLIRDTFPTLLYSMTE